MTRRRHAAQTAGGAEPPGPPGAVMVITGVSSPATMRPAHREQAGGGAPMTGGPYEQLHRWEAGENE